MVNRISLGVNTVDTKPKKFSDVDVKTYLKYIDQAEELIRKGYLSPDTSVRLLAEKLWKQNA